MARKQCWKEIAMLHHEENRWIGRAQAGDKEAFAALVDCYRPSIFRLLQGMAGSVHAAEDLTQETFLKAWANLHSFKPGTYFGAWLSRIGRNVFLNSRRGKRFSIPHRDLPETLATGDPDPLAVLVTKETQSVVERAVAGLSGTSRAAFLLRTREDLPFPEIGRILSLTAATARWHFFRARNVLAKKLGPVLEKKAQT
jgi:RNA polymerase sigma-70 factor (ECF subfamily)